MKHLPATCPRLALVASLGLVLSGCGIVDRLTSSDDFSIQKFTVDQQSVIPGARVTLSWDVDGADVVEIDNGLGRVAAKGSRQVRPEISTTYMLVARAGNAQATATTQVIVRGGGPPVPPLPSPTPAPTPTPSPTPKPSPTPAPSPSPATSLNPPAGKPTPSCGTRTPGFGRCSLNVTKWANLGSSQCLELTAIAFDKDCPVAFATPRKLSFTVTARLTAAEGLTWRRSRASADVLTPATGTLAPQGTTRVEVDDLALTNALVIDILDGERLLMSFTIGHD